MDPNTLLETIRRLVSNYLVIDQDIPENLDSGTVLELVCAVNDLDEWLSSGGFLPDHWQTTRDTQPHD